MPAGGQEKWVKNVAAHNFSTFCKGLRWDPEWDFH
jgi:hypothetical protein